MEKKAVFDIETDNWIDYIVLGFFDGNETTFHETPGSFLDRIDRKQYNGWTFYAHNGGRFDFLFLMDEIERRGWQYKLIESGSGIAAMIIKTKKGYTLNFQDSYALLPASLKKLSDSFQPAHRKQDFDHEKKKKINAQLLRYLENDCLCLYEILSIYYAQEFVTGRAVTYAGQALQTFKDKFLDAESEIYTMPDDDEREFRRRYYAAGRCEVFKGAGRDLFYYDINSSFPAAMTEEMPAGEYRHVTRYHAGLIGFYEIETNIPDMYAPPLLMKGKDKNYFPIGSGRFYVSSATLEYLRREMGLRPRIIGGIVFSKKEYVFNEYVNYFYSMKKQAQRRGDTVKTYLAKLLLNSLYGKLGQNRYGETIETYRGQSEFSIFDEDRALVSVLRRSNSEFILPYLAAYITDIARLNHYKLMQQRPDSLYYVDTDSLITSARMETGSGLGQLSLKAKIKKAVFLNSKEYAFIDSSGQETVVLKGFDSERFTFDDLKGALEKRSKLEQKKIKILSYRECLQGRSSSRVAGRFLRVVEETKAVKSVYDKRHVLPPAPGQYPHGNPIFETRPLNTKEIKK